MNKLRNFVRNAVLFIVLTAVIYLPQYYPPLSYVRHLSRWNWAWPLCLFLGTFFGSFLMKLEVEEEKRGKLIWGGLLFVIALAVAARGVPHLPRGTAAWSTVMYQFFASFMEEFFFRRLGFEGLRRQEEKFYKEPYLKRLGPVSLLLTCVVFGVMHGLNPVMQGKGGFDFAWYRHSFQTSVEFSFIYILTRSIWVPGLAHFLSNLAGIHGDTNYYRARNLRVGVRRRLAGARDERVDGVRRAERVQQSGGPRFSDGPERSGDAGRIHLRRP